MARSSEPQDSPSAETERSSRADGRMLLAFLAIGAGVGLVALWNPFWQHSTPLLAAWAVASLGWAYAVRRVRTQRLALHWIVLGAVALRGLGLAGTPELSDDLNRYLWEGSLVAEGVSPYRHAPNAPELRSLREALPLVHAGLNNPEISAAYPPAIQLVFGAVVRALGALPADPAGAEWMRSGSLAFRVLFSLCDLLVLWPLAHLLARRGARRELLVLWAWCPLVVLEFASSGHFDSLGILTLIAALALLERGRTLWKDASGGLLLAASIFIKLLPLCALPFALREGRSLRRALFVLGACLLWLTPFLFWEGGFHSADRGLTEYGTRWEGFNFLYSWVESGVERVFGGERDRSLTDPRLVGRGLVGLIWLAGAVTLWWRKIPATRATGELMALFLLLTPTVHPWYLTWLVPFLVLRPSRAWVWVVATSGLLYLPLVRWNTEGVWIIPGWTWLVMVIPFVVLIVIERGRPQDLRP